MANSKPRPISFSGYPFTLRLLLLLLGKPSIKNGESWEFIPTGGREVCWDPNLLTGFLKNAQNALKHIINTKTFFYL